MNPEKRILFAEDTPDLNKVVTAMLEHEGYKVESAYDGDHAADLARLNFNKFDTIILDIMMPRKDGLQVLSEIRERGDKTPVIMLTAKAEVDDRVTGLDLGANDYLTKPFAMKELLARVRALVRLKEESNDAASFTEDITYVDVTLHSEDLSMSSVNTVRLSPKEFILMKELIHVGDKGLDSEDIYFNLWQDQDADHDGNLDTKEERDEAVFLYVSYLRAKLEGISSDVEILGDEGGHYTVKADSKET